MKPSENAKELVERFRVVELSRVEDICKTIKAVSLDVAKKYALICVDEKIGLLKYFFGAYNMEDEWFEEMWNRKLKELEEIKQEIEKL